MGVAAEPGFEGPEVAMAGVFGWPVFGWPVGDRTEPGLGVFGVEEEEEEEEEVVEMGFGDFGPALGAMEPVLDEDVVVGFACGVVVGFACGVVVSGVVFGGVTADAVGTLGDWGKVTRGCMQISIFECER